MPVCWLDHGGRAYINGLGEINVAIAAGTKATPVSGVALAQRCSEEQTGQEGQEKERLHF